MDKNSITIVIPLFNEISRLQKCLDQITLFQAHDDSVREYIFVDDGSTDRCADGLQEILVRKKIPGRVLFNRTNCGKGFSVKKGVLSSTSDYCLFTDVDFSVPLTELSKLTSVFNLLLDRRGLVIGSRLHEKSEIKTPQPRLRRIMGRIYQLLVQRLIGLSLLDTQCGFKIFDYRTGKKIFEPLVTTGFGFDIEIIARAKHLGIPVTEVGTIWIDDKDSKVNIFIDPIKMILDLFRLRQALGREVVKKIKQNEV
ncbi:glycosyltransferase [Gammaproteobacteria bacterium]|nr:glycosyltransferase [Gammaproteobacteria bacterium]